MVIDRPCSKHRSRQIIPSITQRILLASTSQISHSLHTRRRDNHRPLTPFFVGGIALVLTPAVMVFCQDAALRQQMCEGAHSFGASVTQQAHKLFRNASQGGIVDSRSETAEAGVKTGGPGSGKPKGKGPALTAISSTSSSSSSSTSTSPSTAPTPSEVASSVSMVDQAVSVLSAQIAKDPNNPALHNRLGLIYASVGEMQRAEMQFNQAVDGSREQLRDLNAQLSAKKDAGQIAQASQLMLDINQLELELSSAHSNLARVFEKLGQQSKVLAQLEQLNKDVIIGEHPSNAAVSPAVVAPKPVAIKSAAGAEAAPKKVSLQLVATLAKAQALLQAGRVQEATPLLHAALAIDPNISDVHEQLGIINLNAGNFGKAVDELNKASAISPNKGSIHAALGVAYQYKGKLKEAINEFSRAVALNPKDASSAFNLGNAYAAQGKNDDATRCYQKAVAGDPNMAVAHNNLASLYSLKGNYELAAREFEAALSLAPKMESAHYGLGLALYHTQDYGSASREFQAALAINPNLVDAQQKIAMCQKQSGQLSRHMYQDVAMR